MYLTKVEGQQQSSVSHAYNLSHLSHAIPFAFTTPNFNRIGHHHNHNLPYMTMATNSQQQLQQQLSPQLQPVAEDVKYEQHTYDVAASQQQQHQHQQRQLAHLQQQQQQAQVQAQQQHQHAQQAQQQAQQHHNAFAPIPQSYPQEPLISQHLAQQSDYAQHHEQHHEQQQQDQQSRQQQLPEFDNRDEHSHSPKAHVATSTGDVQKGNRLRKACDSCSIRKVKCDESGPPCRACASLEIPCTFDRPSRRRGPPNRHAEAIKRRRLEQEGGGSLPISSPTSPNNIAATLASFSSHGVLNAESICPFPTLELLLDDFFTYIHPLVPFPHEPSFRAAFKHREDLQNPAFLALLASMVGALVASFPRKPRLHLKAQKRESLFPNSISLVERCHKVAVEARGAGYLDKDLTVYDAATSYFLGLAGAYTFKWKQCRLYFAETLTIIRILGVHKTKDPGYYSAAAVSGVAGSIEEGTQPTEQVDFIKQEIGRRIFWVTFVGVKSVQQMGAAFAELAIAPPTRNDPYPPLPLEIDDEHLYVSHVEPQRPGTVSKIAGFNLNVRTYMSYTPIATIEMAYGVDELFDWPRQKRIFEECLQNAKRVLEDAPRQLLLSPDADPGEYAMADSRDYFPPATDVPGERLGPADESYTRDEETRVKLQYEIQKANIFASQLATRSYIVEKYWNLYEAMQRQNATGSPRSAHNSPAISGGGIDGIIAMTSPQISTPTTSNAANMSNGTYEAIDTQMSSERESIVKDLLLVLGSISQVNMEPNGGSFIAKIRQIASTLLDMPRNRKSPLALRAEEYLAHFMDVLMKLERVSPAKSGGAEWEDEEEELRNWADLREFQHKFLSGGGFDQL